MVKEFKEYFSNPFVWAALFCAVLIYSLPNSCFVRKNNFNCLVENPTLLRGKIASNPVKTSKGSYYSADFFVVEAVSTSSNIKSACKGNVKILIPSSIVEQLYPGKLFSLSNSKGVLVEKNQWLLIKGSFSDDKGVYIVSYAEEISPKKTSIFDSLYKIRALYRLSLKRLLYGWGEAGGLILSLLSGSREYLDSNISENFKKAGLSHVLALSGMHLGFFFSISSFFGIKLFGKKRSYLFSLAVLLLFVSFVGFTPSLTRSFIFIIFIIMSKKVNVLNINHFELLCVVFLIHVVLLPNDAFEISFMLSYGALSGILLLSGYFERFFSRYVPRKSASSLAASTSAQIFTFPVSYLKFGEIMPIGIISTLFVSPLISIFMSVSLFAIIICLVVPFLSRPFGCIMKLLYRGICLLVGIFARVPSLTF